MYFSYSLYAYWPFNVAIICSLMAHSTYQVLEVLLDELCKNLSSKHLITHLNLKENRVGLNGTWGYLKTHKAC